MKINKEQNSNSNIDITRCKYNIRDLINKNKEISLSQLLYFGSSLFGSTQTQTSFIHPNKTFNVINNMPYNTNTDTAVKYIYTYTDPNTNIVYKIQAPIIDSYFTDTNINIDIPN